MDFSDIKLPDINKEWLLNKDALFWGLSLGFATKSQAVMIIAFLIGHWIKLDDILEVLKELAEPLGGG